MTAAGRSAKTLDRALFPSLPIGDCPVPRETISEPLPTGVMQLSVSIVQAETRSFENFKRDYFSGISENVWGEMKV